MPTIYEVARLAGVSPKTTARILSGDSPRSKHREKVLSCARELGYVRNQQAANLRTGRSQLIGVVVPYIDNPFYTKFLQEIHNVLHDRGYHSLIACSFGRSEGLLDALRMFETYKVDGITIDVSEGVLTPEIHAAMEHMQSRGQPIVITGAQLHDIIYDHLYLDNRRAMAKVVRHLKARNHATVAFVGGYAENMNIMNRLDGLKASAQAHGLTIKPKWISLGNPAVASVHQRVAQMLSAPDRPSAIVCSSDMIAITVMKAAFELDLSVPGDVAVTGFDDIDQAGLVNPSLTTVRQPMAIMAKDIVDLLLRQQARATSEVAEKRYEAELVIRDST